MKTYNVKPEFWDQWFGGMSTDEIGEAVVTDDEIHRLANEWAVPYAELLEQVEEI